CKSLSFTNTPLTVFPSRFLISSYASCTQSSILTPNCCDRMVNTTTISPIESICFSLFPFIIPSHNSPNSSPNLITCLYGSFVFNSRSQDHTRINCNNSFILTFIFHPSIHFQLHFLFYYMFFLQFLSHVLNPLYAYLFLSPFLLRNTHHYQILLCTLHHISFVVMDF